MAAPSCLSHAGSAFDSVAAGFERRVERHVDREATVARGAAIHRTAPVCRIDKCVNVNGARMKCVQRITPEKHSFPHACCTLHQEHISLEARHLGSTAAHLSP